MRSQDGDGKEANGNEAEGSSTTIIITYENKNEYVFYIMNMQH